MKKKNKLSFSTFKQDKEAIYRIRLNQNIENRETNEILASAGTRIKIYELSSKKIISKLSGHTAPVTDLLFVPSNSSTLLLSCSSDRFIYLWNLNFSSQHSSKDFLVPPIRCKWKYLFS